MIIDELFEGPQLCPECGGISFSDLILAEKKDACYYKVKASAKVWPSAYASGRLVQCRKKGAANYGKSKTEGVAEATGDEKFDTMMGRIQQEPKYPDPQMPPTDVKDLYQWAVKNNKPYHKIFAEWANREGFKSVAQALHKAGTLDSDYLDYWTPDIWKLYWGEIRGIDSEMPPEWAKERIPDELRDYLETVFDAYDHIVFDWPTEYRQIGQQGMAEQQELDEKWSQKYKKSINCANPKGFSQRAHCAGRKKNEDVAEAGPSRRDPLDYPPLEGPGGSGAGGYTGGPSPFRGLFGRGKEAPVTEPKWSTTKIPGVDVHTGPPPKVTVQKRGAEYEPLASEVPAYVRKGLPDPVTVPKPGTKPKITIKPGETVDQAIQRTRAEQEFGQFLQGKSGQTFGPGAGRGATNPQPASQSNNSNLTMDQIIQRWDQQNQPAKSKGYRPWGTEIDEESKKKHAKPEVDYDDDYDAMVARVKKLAGLGPMKTVYDPTKRVYRNMPTAQQPKK